jgi:MFS family permease
MFLASLVFSIAEIALAPVSSYTIALGLFVVIGAAMVTFSAIANSYIQLTVPHGLRGRVMSIYTTVFVGTTPIGNTLAGGIAQISGAFGPLLFGGALSLAATLWCAYRFPRSPPPPVPRRTARHRAPDHD